MSFKEYASILTLKRDRLKVKVKSKTQTETKLIFPEFYLSDLNNFVVFVKNLHKSRFGKLDKTLVFLENL